MNSPKLYYLAFAFISLIISCKESGFPENNNAKEVLLRIQIKPAFQEHSEIILYKKDTLQYIQIVLNNYLNIEIPRDTFWFKKIMLTDKEYAHFDTTLIRLCNQKIAPNSDSSVWTDGMTFNSMLLINKDTNYISFGNQPFPKGSAGYNFEYTLFTLLGSTFKDSLTTEYFTEMEGYLDESKYQRADPKRKIDRLRMNKYNWRIRNNSDN